MKGFSLFDNKLYRQLSKKSIKKNRIFSFLRNRIAVKQPQTH